MASCGSFRQNIMFISEQEPGLKKATDNAERNYVIAKNDLLELRVFTNDGERIIEPPVAVAVPNQTQSTAQSQQNTPLFLIDINGVVKLPLLGETKLEGLTVRQAEAMLQKEYTRFYEAPFVSIKLTNKRVIVLGSTIGQVVPLTSENMRLTEILALSKAVTPDAKANNIKVIRGQELFTFDFSTFESYVNNDIIVRPGDIVYVEPVKRPFLEALREYGSIITIITSLGTLAIVIFQSAQ